MKIPSVSKVQPDVPTFEYLTYSLKAACFDATTTIRKVTAISYSHRFLRIFHSDQQYPVQPKGPGKKNSASCYPLMLMFGMFPSDSPWVPCAWHPTPCQSLQLCLWTYAWCFVSEAWWCIDRNHRSTAVILGHLPACVLLIFADMVAVQLLVVRFFFLSTRSKGKHLTLQLFHTLLMNLLLSRWTPDDLFHSVGYNLLVLL